MTAGRPKRVPGANLVRVARYTMIGTGLTCYVLGCRPDRAVLTGVQGEAMIGPARGLRSVRHARFGRVCSCADHDPNRYDAGLPIVVLRAVPPAETRARAPYVYRDGLSADPSSPVPIHPVPPAPSSPDAIDPYADLDRLQLARATRVDIPF